MYLYLYRLRLKSPVETLQLANTSSSTSLAAKGQREKQRQRHMKRDTQRGRLEFYGEEKALFLVKINAVWNPQNLGWGGGRGGMLHGLYLHLCLSLLLLECLASSYLPYSLKELGFTSLRGSQITLFPSCNQAGP